MYDGVSPNVWQTTQKNRRWQRNEHLILLTTMRSSMLTGAVAPGWLVVLPWWRLVGARVADGLVVCVWALTKNKLLLLWLKCPNIKEWMEKQRGVGTNGFFKHRTRQEYCTGYDIVSNISPTVEIQFHSSWTISNKHGGSKCTTLQWYCIKRWHGALKESRWVKGRLRAAGNPYLDQSPYPDH